MASGLAWTSIVGYPLRWKSGPVILEHTTAQYEIDQSPGGDYRAYVHVHECSHREIMGIYLTLWGAKWAVRRHIGRHQP